MKQFFNECLLIRTEDITSRMLGVFTWIFLSGIALLAAWMIINIIEI